MYRDTRKSFGLVSIALHWFTAIFICTLWFIGDGIAALDPNMANARRELHVSIAVFAYLILWARIIWRLYSIHPQAAGQSRLTHRIARIIHYLLLASIAGMLCSGPVMLWSTGSPVSVFGLFDFPAAATQIPAINEVAGVGHSFCGKALLWLTVIHVAGALKHLMFHSDETIARMFIPKRQAFEPVSVRRPLKK